MEDKSSYTFLLPPTTKYNQKLKRATWISFIGDCFMLLVFLGFFLMDHVIPTHRPTPIFSSGTSIAAKTFLIFYTPLFNTSTNNSEEDPLFSLRCALSLGKMLFIRILMMTFDYTLFISGIVDLGDSDSSFYKFGMGIMAAEMFYTVLFSLYLTYLIPDVLKVKRCTLEQEQVEAPWIVVENGMK